MQNGNPRNFKEKIQFISKKNPMIYNGHPMCYLLKTSDLKMKVTRCFYDVHDTLSAIGMTYSLPHQTEY
jgi:hypothetical protein